MKRRPAPLPAGQLAGVPPELYDPDHELWSNRDLYVAYMKKHGWRMSSRERSGRSSPPGARRQRAAEGWAEETETALNKWHRADSDRLREMGLIE